MANDINVSFSESQNIEVTMSGIVSLASGGSGVSADLQERTFSTTILVDKDYASMASNALTQSGSVAITLDTTGALNGKYNANEIDSDGNTWTITPTSGIAIIQNNATGVSVTNNIITPTNGNRYLLTFWYVNSKWNVIINDWTAFVADSTAPTIGTFAIDDANPDRITFVTPEIVTASTFGGFTISTGQTVTGITINAGQLTGHYFTVDTAFTEADGTPTIAYSGTGCNIQDADSNLLASFTATNITNNVVDPPAFVSAEIGTVADDILVVVYDKAVNATTAGHNLDTDGSALSISSISSGSGTTTINFQLSRSVIDTETLNYDYSQATGSTVATASGKELSEITDEAVTNNVSGSQIVMQDSFTGTVIDTAKWTVTDTSDSVTITQNNVLTITGDGSANVAVTANYLTTQSKAELSSGQGTIQARAFTTQTTYNASASIELKWADTGGGINRINIGKDGGTSTNLRIVVTVDGAATSYTSTGLAYNISRIYRCSYNGTNAVVDYWNGSAWVNLVSHAVSTSFFTGAAYAILYGGNNTGGDTKTHTYDVFFMTTEVGYSTSEPL